MDAATWNPIPNPPIEESFVVTEEAIQGQNEQVNELAQKMAVFSSLSPQDQAVLFATMVKICQLQQSMIDQINRSYNQGQEGSLEKLSSSFSEQSVAVLPSATLQGRDQIINDLLSCMQFYQMLPQEEPYLTKKLKLAEAACKLMITGRDMIQEEMARLKSLNQEAQKLRALSEQLRFSPEEKKEIEQSLTNITETAKRVTENAKEVTENAKEVTKNCEEIDRVLERIKKMQEEERKTILGFRSLYKLGERIGLIGSGEKEGEHLSPSQQPSDHAKKEEKPFTKPMLVAIGGFIFFLHVISPRISQK